MDPETAKKDTVAGEIMYETQAIQDAMEGLGMSDYEDDEEEEEEARMKMMDVNQLSVISEESVGAVEQYFQKLLTVEEEKMSMRSYEARDTSPRTTPHTSPASSQPDKHSILGTSGAGSVCSDVPDHCVIKMEPHDSSGMTDSFDTVETPRDKDATNQTDVYLADEVPSLEDAPLVKPKITSKLEKLGSSLKSKLQNLEFAKGKEANTNKTEDVLLTAASDKTPLLTPATSKEHLSVRQANHVPDSSGPSAFHVVSPTKSQPGSHRASRASSLDNMRTACSPSEPRDPVQSISLHAISQTEPGRDGENGPRTTSDGALLIDSGGNTYKREDLPSSESCV